ncbi:unnamed protein product [Orchesella dallaii]|uniref:Uncharacterized protein n=1 Tax=Orchesella dallaii TaxID=48710 RepID=A0ABP1QZK6_9HEXA
METPNKHGSFIIGSETDQVATGLPICEIQPVQKTITDIRIDRANLDVSIEGECNTHIDPTDETYDGKLFPSDHFLSQQTPNNLMMSVNCNEAMDNEETDNDSSDLSEVDLENVEKADSELAHQMNYPEEFLRQFFKLIHEGGAFLFAGARLVTFSFLIRHPTEELLEL